MSGFGSYNLTNAGNDIDTLAVLRPWGSSNGQNISYADVNGFDVGKIAWNSTLSFKTALGVTWTWTGPKTADGIQNNGAWPGYGFGGAGGDVRLSAGGTGAITLESGISTGGLVAISAAGGVTEDPGAGITAGSLKLTGQGAFSLDGPNNVGSLAASLSNTGGITFTNSGNLAITSVDGISGIQVSGPGATNISVRSTTGDLTVSQEVRSIADLGASVKTSAASVSLRAFDDLTVAGNVVAQGGATSTGDSASIWLESDVGGVFQTGGLINAVDMGGVTPSAQSPHRSRVLVRAAGNSLDAGTVISIPGLCGILGNALTGCNGGKLTLSNVSASSVAGSAAIDVFGPGGITISGPMTATAQTAPRINITADIQDGDKKLKSSRDIRVDGAITVSQPGGADVNKRLSTETAGLLMSGQNITNTRILSTSGDYGISMFAQGGIDAQADINTSSIAGVALSTAGAQGFVRTSNGARVNAKQLALVGGRDKGIFKLTTNVENLQVLGARALVIDNSAFTNELLAVIGRVSEATTDPLTGTAIPAADSPVGATSLKTGGRLTILSLNNQSSSSYNLDGVSVADRRPLTLISDSLVETPGTFKVDPNTEVTLRPFTTGRPIVVRNLPAQAPDPNSTYYLAGFAGVLAQLDGNVRLVVGGDGYTGNISVGSQDVPGIFPASEQFSLGSMEIVFSTAGRVYNRFSTNPDSPSNWASGLLLFAPYSPTPDVFCAVGSACISKITKGNIFIKDSFSNGATQRNIVFKGNGDGSGATSIPPTGGNNGNNGTDGDSSSPGPGDSDSSGPTESPSDGAPTGGGNNGTPADVAQTEVKKTDVQPNVTVAPAAPSGDPGIDTTPLDDLLADLSPDGGNSSPTGGGQFAGLKDKFSNETIDTDLVPFDNDDIPQPGPIFPGNPLDDLDDLNNPKLDDKLVQDITPKLSDTEGPEDPDVLVGSDVDVTNDPDFSSETPTKDTDVGDINPSTEDGPGKDILSTKTNTDDLSNPSLADTSLDGGGPSDLLIGTSDGPDGSSGGLGGANLSSTPGVDSDSTDLVLNGNSGLPTGTDIDGTLGGGTGGQGGAGGGSLSANGGDSLGNGPNDGQGFGDGSGGFSDGAGSGSGFAGGASGDGAGNGSGSGGGAVSDGLAGNAGGASLSSSDGASGRANSGLDSGAGSGNLSGAFSGEADGLASSVGGGSLSDGNGSGADGNSNGETGGALGFSGQFAGLSLGSGEADGGLGGDGTSDGASGGASMSTSGQSGFGLGSVGAGNGEQADATAGDGVSAAGSSGLSGRAANPSGFDGDIKLASGGAQDADAGDSRGGAQSSGLSGGSGGRGSASNSSEFQSAGPISSGGSGVDGGSGNSITGNARDNGSSIASNSSIRATGTNDEAFACVADRNQDTRALRATAGQAMLTVKGAGVRLARGSCGDAGAKNSSN